MTVVVGCDPNVGLLSLYNFTTNKKSTFDVCKKTLMCIVSVDSNNDQQIDQFFDDIRFKFSGKIDNFYVYLDYNYTNEFRKKFVAAAKINNIENVEIISSHQSKLIGGITNLLIYPKHGNYFWIFDISEIEIFCYIWKFDESFGWKYKGSYSQEKTFIGKFERPTFNDLLKLKQQMNVENNKIKPFINVFCVESTVAEKDFEKIFPMRKYIIYHKFYEHHIWLVDYGIYLAKGKDLIRNKNDAILERSIEIFVGNEIVCASPNLAVLPFLRTAFTDRKQNELLKICEDGNCVMTLPLDKAMCITLSVDVNGIFTGKLEPLDDCHVNQDLSLPNIALFDQVGAIAEISKPDSIKMPNNQMNHNLPLPNIAPVFMEEGHEIPESETIKTPNDTSGKSLEELVNGLGNALQYFTLQNTSKKSGQADSIKNYANIIPENSSHSFSSMLAYNPFNYEIKFVPEVSKEIQTVYDIPSQPTTYDPELPVVGIDLGTTECCAAIIRMYGPDFPILDDITKLRTLPSYVAFEEEEPKCGKAVIDRMRAYENFTVFDSKRIIGKKFEDIKIDPIWPFNVTKAGNEVVIEVETHLGADVKSPEEISAALLHHIKIKTEAFKGKALTEAVITIPSKFSEKQKSATKIAAEMAGWEIVHFIPEPVAAAFAYFTETDIPNESNILICDCGGGTVDICVAKISDGKLEVLNYDGDLYLGGRDFDKILFDHFSDILVNKYGIDLMENGKKYLLKQTCQEMKHSLSVSTEARLDVSDFDQKNDTMLCIGRDEFEAMSADLLQQIENVIRRVIFEKIDYVFEVGGSCKMPMIKQLLKNIFPNAIQKSSLNPDWVVAHGAALYAYYLKTIAT